MKIVILQGAATRHRRRSAVAPATTTTTTTAAAAAADARPERGVPALGNGEGQWVLINVSPAVAHPLDSDARLDRHLGLPDAEVRAVVLTDPQIDSVGGLLSLRGGAPIDLYATPAEFEQLTITLPVLPVLQYDCGVHWHVVPVAGGRRPAGGRLSGRGPAQPGVHRRGQPALRGAARPWQRRPQSGHGFALAVRDLGTGQRLFCAAGSHPPSETEIAWMHEADCLMLDPPRPPLAGNHGEPGHDHQARPNDWLTLLHSLPALRKVLLGEVAGHSRPAARTGSGNRMANDGIALAYDGMEIDLCLTERRADPKPQSRADLPAPAPGIPQLCAGAGSRYNRATHSGTPTHRFRNMKTRLQPDAVVANPRDTKRYRCGMRLGVCRTWGSARAGDCPKPDRRPGLRLNPSFSSCFETSGAEHWPQHDL